MGTGLGNDAKQLGSYNRRSRIILYIALCACLAVAALLGGLPIVVIVANYTVIFTVATYLDRRVFPGGLSLRRCKSGWLVLGAILGACVGSVFAPSCSDLPSHSLGTVIYTMVGTVSGTAVGMAIDLAKNFPSFPIRFQFRIWHALAFFYIFTWSIYIVLSFIELFRVASMPR